MSAAVAAARRQGFRDPKDHVSRTCLDLDPQAHEELFELVESVVDRALELHGEAASRLEKLPPDGREEHRIALTLMSLHRDPEARPTNDPDLPLSPPGPREPGSEAEGQGR